MKMNNVYFLTFDDTYHKFEILKCGNALFTKYYPPPLIDVIYIVFTDWHRLVYKNKFINTAYLDQFSEVGFYSAVFSRFHTCQF